MIAVAKGQVFTRARSVWTPELWGILSDVDRGTLTAEFVVTCCNAIETRGFAKTGETVQTREVEVRRVGGEGRIGGRGTGQNGTGQVGTTRVLYNTIIPVQTSDSRRIGNNTKRIKSVVYIIIALRRKRRKEKREKRREDFIPLYKALEGSVKNGTRDSSTACIGHRSYLD